MIVEEKQAGLYWCPFVRQLATATEPGHPMPKSATVTAMAAINRGAGGGENGQGFMGMCIGQKCMAWRWHREQSDGAVVGWGGKQPISDTHGYCGLAGGAR